MNKDEIIGMPQLLKTRILYELPFFECDKDEFELRSVKPVKKFDVKERLRNLFSEHKNEKV